MTWSLRGKRFIFFTLATACIGLAFALPRNSSGESNAQRVTGLYQSDLLDDEVSIPTLSAFTFTEDFQDLVGASVNIEPVRESPFHIQVTTQLPTEAGLLTAHKRAIHLLSAEVREQALREVSGDIKYLEAVKRKAEKLRNGRVHDETRIAATTQRSPHEALSAKDSQRLVFLKEEIKSAKLFLGGGPLPKTVRARLDRESLNAAEKRVRNQQTELSRLAKLFHPSSKAIQAQRGSLEAAQADLAEIERQLAQVYLRALELELETLDDKASRRIQHDLSQQDAGTTTPTSVPASSGSAWLDDRRKELEDRGRSISDAAPLKLEGKLMFSLVQSPTALPWTVGCWAGALVFFLLAIFSVHREGEPFDSLPTERPQKRRKATLPTRLELLQTSATNNYPDALERFFETVCSEITATLNRPPRRLLVVGDSDTEARLAFSIRLANVLGRQAQKVRLIDFDFKGRGLSERLGRQDLPGVSELILNGGPVDEFFSSIPGTRIQFAPAGKASPLATKVKFERLSQILGKEKDEVTIVDSSSVAPLELLSNHVDAVCWSTGHQRDQTSHAELETLTRLLSVGVPVWGVSQSTLEFFPLP